MEAQIKDIRRAADYLPGISLAAVAAAIGLLTTWALPVLSPLLIAIVLGVATTNLFHLPAKFSPGTHLAAKKLLRLGIVFLGLRLALQDIWDLGVPMLLVVTVVVVVGIVGTVMLGRALAVPKKLTLLIGCGFSICGAAAVAGVEETVEADDEDVVTAVALVVIFGTLMIPLVPTIVFAADVSPIAGGLWAGAFVHEVAQVVAVGDLIGPGALEVAVVTKLARVLLLAPVVVVLGLMSRRSRESQHEATSGRNSRRPALVPLFIIGFLAMSAVRTTGLVPDALLDGAGILQTVLLSMAMFALGLGVKVRELRRVGPRPFGLAALSTLLVAGTAAAGVSLIGG